MVRASVGFKALPQHLGRDFMPHFLGSSNAFLGGIPIAGRTDLYWQRQFMSPWRMALQHRLVGGGGDRPVTAGRHFASCFVLMLQISVAPASAKTKNASASARTNFKPALDILFFCPSNASFLQKETWTPQGRSTIYL